jgi:hypothetical protein
MIAAMKHVIAIALLCLPTGLSAGDRCGASGAGRVSLARAQIARPAAKRPATVRPQDLDRLRVWHSVLFEQQIL